MKNITTVLVIIIILSINIRPQSSIWKLDILNKATGYGDNVNRQVSVFGGTGVIGAASSSWGGTQYKYVHANNWLNGSGTKGYKIEVKTTNFNNITLSFSMSSQDYNGTNIGPRDFKVQYSLDDINYTDIAGCSLTLGNGWSEVVTKTNIDLPAQCDNTGAVFFRWIMTSNIGVNGKTITLIAEANLGNIDVKGNAMPLPPSNITLSDSTILPNAAAGTAIGTFTVEDFNEADTHTLTLVSGDGDTDNASFEIAGDVLKNKVELPKGTYSIRVNANDGTYDYAKTFTIIADIIYPDAAGLDQSWDYITNVKFNTIDNTSDGSSGGYVDYTNTAATTLHRDESYTLSITNPPTDVIDPSYPEAIKAWIDWNHNGSFDDAGEAYEVAINLTEQTNSTVDIHVPGDAIKTETRMRIVIWADDPSAYPPNAGDIWYGEVEDYAITIDEVLPVEMTAFTATLENNIVKLNWETATEVNNYGFEIEKSEIRDQKSADNWVKVGFVKGSGNSNSQKGYSYTDKPGTIGKIKYRLKQIDTDGRFEYSKEIELEVNKQPAKYALMQNYPNPFNPVTNINYTLPYSSMVKITVYSINGEAVKSLVNSVKEAGSYTITLQANDLSSGVYFYKLEAVSTQGKGEFAKSRKLLILK